MASTSKTELLYSCQIVLKSITYLTNSMLCRLYIDIILSKFSVFCDRGSKVMKELLIKYNATIVIRFCRSYQ